MSRCYAAMTFSPSDPNAQDRFTALSQRVGSRARGARTGSRRSPTSRPSSPSRRPRWRTRRSASSSASAMLEDLLQGIEQAPQEEVAAQMLALQTRLQASLQTTAMLYQTEHRAIICQASESSAKTARRSRASLREGSGAAEQAGGELAVDVDQRRRASRAAARSSATSSGSSRTRRDWRRSGGSRSGSGLSWRVTEVRKIDQSLRL